MGYSAVILGLVQTYVGAATIALNRNEPYIAAMCYENINMLLPPKREGQHKFRDEEGQEIDVDLSVLSDENLDPRGYRVDLSKYKPQQINKREHDKPYLSQSNLQEVQYWTYVATISGLVMEAVSRFALAQRDQMVNG